MARTIKIGGKTFFFSHDQVRPFNEDGTLTLQNNGYLIMNRGNTSIKLNSIFVIKPGESLNRLGEIPVIIDTNFDVTFLNDNPGGTDPIKRLEIFESFLMSPKVLKECLTCKI